MPGRALAPGLTDVNKSHTVLKLMKLAFHWGERDTEQINKTPADSSKAMRTVRQSNVMGENSGANSYCRWDIWESLSEEVLVQN